MKRFFAIFLILLFFLSGCHSSESSETAFFYCRDPKSDPYFEDGSVISEEYRDLAGHRNDLQYMVGLYLAGPVEEGLVAPFPKSVRLLSVKKEKDCIRIELSEHSQMLTDSEYALACACLTLTCLNYTDCQAVCVSSGTRSLTMTADQILLLDTIPQQETIGGK